jgi:hypothetical protein
MITLTDKALPGMGAYTHGWLSTEATMPAPGAAKTEAGRSSAGC